MKYVWEGLTNVQMEYHYWIITERIIADEYYNKTLYLNNSESTNDYVVNKILLNILPAISFCLQLPRNATDVLEDVDIRYANRHDNCSHDIVIISKEEIESSITDYLKLSKDYPYVIICQDSCYHKVKNKLNYMDSDIISMSQLDTQMLNIIWNKVGSSIQKNFLQKFSNEPRVLFSGKNIKLIPLSFRLNRFPLKEGYYKDLVKYNDHKAIFNAFLYCQNMINSLLIKLKEPSDITSISIAFSMPGSPNNAISKLTNGEEEAIRILGVHKAIQAKATFWEFGILPVQLYNHLNEIETHCQYAEVYDTKFIWKKLRDIGEILGRYLNRNDFTSFNYITRIIALTNFPIGIAILPENKVPLACFEAIEYKPLIPLTTMLQAQVKRDNNIYYSKRINVIILECIPKDNEIRYASNVAWEGLRHVFNNTEINILYCEVKSISDLKTVLDSNNCDILIISAHGGYNSEQKITALQVGEECWFGINDDIKLPPVVILSACHTSPRGVGAMSIADQMLRLGARVVIGSTIPIQVDRNIILITRLFTYILEGLRGSKAHETLLDAWMWVTTSNAVYEVIATSPPLQHWMNCRCKCGYYPIKEFTMRFNKKKTGMKNIYSDTIDILKELARENSLVLDDMILDVEACFPESIFYQIIGDADSIFLYRDDTFMK